MSKAFWFLLTAVNQSLEKQCSIVHFILSRNFKKLDSPKLIGIHLQKCPVVFFFLIVDELFQKVRRAKYSTEILSSLRQCYDLGFQISGGISVIEVGK